MPGVLLLPTRGVQTSFLAPVHLLVVLGAWLVLLGVGWALLRGRVPWGVVAAVGGVVVARCALGLFAMSSTGPGGYWFAFWTEPDRRTVYVTVAVALFLWLLVAAAWALSVTRGAPCGGHRAAAVGAGLAVPGRRRRRSSGSSGRSRRGTTRWGCCRGACRASSASPSTSASRPTPRGGPPGSGRRSSRHPACSPCRAAATTATRARSAHRQRLSTWLAGRRSAAAATEDAAEHVADDAAGVEARPLTRHRPDARRRADPPVALPRTSRSMSSSEPGALPPPPPGSEGAVSAGAPAVPCRRARRHRP